MNLRPYTYFDFTQSLCSKCLKTISTKIVFENEQVYMLKNCLDHGQEKVLIEDDATYYRNIRNYVKQSEMPKKFGTAVEKGCPQDCGLCTDHEQHSCLSIIEVTDRCNLSCPTCYASSSPTNGRHRTLEEVKRMFDTVVEYEGTPDVVQISGGEPTLHPQFFEILDYAKTKPIRHIMLNTNGIRIATEPGFAQELKAYSPAFEIYLQFDSFKASTLERLRGADLRDIRARALKALNEVNLSTTLVVTLQKGHNDDEIGTLIDFALKQKCVRGITFQPTQNAGRNQNYTEQTNRMTMTGVRRSILEQSKVFSAEDLLPVPCNPDALIMGYALKVEDQVIPLTRFVNPDMLLRNDFRNTIIYEGDKQLKETMIKIFSTGESVENTAIRLNSLLCCLPEISAPNLTYENVFRVIVMKFMDAHDFDVRAVKKSCVHIVSKDYKMIPFETMNLFYRNQGMSL
jgi:uncharacterized radical SAM superfamily Fe-S cluster-containing enzyme